jgi:predicted RNase H-like nuclease
MGKKRITQLLDQLKSNQQMELQNAAAIFTVAQVAVNELQEQVVSDIAPTVAALQPASDPLDKAELLRRYGSYNGCREAAKKQGIKFSRTPRWEQLSTAFSYTETCRQLIQGYLEAHPHKELKGVSIELKLGAR